MSPAYAIYSNVAIMSSAEARPVSLSITGDRFVLDLERTRAAIDGNTRMLVVNSPSNPTGWVISEEEQRALVAMAERHDIVILADEVYERLVYGSADEPKGSSPQGIPVAPSSPQGIPVAPSSPQGIPVAPSFARFVENRDRLIVVNSFSKTYNMTGWRLGWAQSSERTIKAMYKAVEFITSNPAAMVQQAGIVALREGEQYIKELRKHYGERREQVKAALESLPGVSLPNPQGAFYAFPKFQFATDSTSFTAALVRETGVALAPGAAFGRDGEGYIRVCFASTPATIADAMTRLTQFVMTNHGPR